MGRHRVSIDQILCVLPVVVSNYYYNYILELHIEIDLETDVVMLNKNLPTLELITKYELL